MFWHEAAGRETAGARLGPGIGLLLRAIPLRVTASALPERTTRAYRRAYRCRYPGAALTENDCAHHQALPMPRLFVTPRRAALTVAGLAALSAAAACAG